MFEVLISTLKTGQVERKVFATRHEATAYLALRETKLLTPRRGRKRMPSLRDYRLEVRPAVVRGLAA